MISDSLIPRRKDGNIRMCEFCQRDMWWRGGFLPMLIWEVERMAERQRRGSGR